MSQSGSSQCFVLACDGNYFPYACLAALRACEVGSKALRGYILHAGASPDQLRIAAGLLGDRVELIEAADLIDGLPHRYSERITQAAYLRLFIDLVPQFEPYSRVIYFDCDVLFNRDPAELASIDMQAPLLAAHDLPSYYDLEFRKRLPLQPGAPYFNSGVLVFDMPAVRRLDCLERARRFAAEFPDICIQHDQDALNVAFEGRWQTLHPLWNAMTNLHWMPPLSATFARHFSSRKPWSKNPVGVELDAIAIYRRLAAGTEWAARFPEPSLLTTFTLAMKSYERRARGTLVNVWPHERRLRRARFDRNLPSIVALLADQADRRLGALPFPEKAFGLS
jgi:lipopolysaccharide biosynthesis glycosyltransferase